MASILAPKIAPDVVLSFEIKPGTLPPSSWRLAREGGTPAQVHSRGASRSCHRGCRTRSPKGRRSESSILAICLELRIKFKSLASTTWTLPRGAGDTAYEAYAAYYIPRHDRAKPRQAPDLAVEIVVTNPASKALRAGALLKIPEMCVLDIPRHRLTLLSTLATRRQTQGGLSARAPEPGIPLPLIGP